ncbi:transposase [Gordonia sp. VNK21]|uniref:transposase n=1 Tax=Gordonia sp. VNK21 TaxID=3382483 RepID=UPI0038D3CF3C
MPKPYPREFRDDVVRVARDRVSGVTIEQIAKDSGVPPTTLTKWMRRADTDDGSKLGMTSGQSAALREANKRIRLLEQRMRSSAEQRRICRRRTCQEKALPARDRARR